MMVLTLAICAWADNFLQNSANFTAYVQGIDVIRFTLPTQMWSSYLNEGITDGHVYVSVDGAPKTLLLEWNAGENYRDINGKYSTTCRVKGHVGGAFKLTGKTDGGEKAFKPDGDWTAYVVRCNDENEDHYTTTVDWTVPRNLRGHKLVFYLWCRSRDRDNSWYIPKDNEYETDYYKMAEWDCPAAPEASVQLSEPMVAFDPDHVNTIMFTYSFSARKVNWAKLHYKDALSNEEKVMEVKGGALVDILYLPADRPYSYIKMEAGVVDSEGKTVADPVWSEPVSSFMMHHPSNLCFAPTAEGNVQLTWKVNNANEDDIIADDYFEVQRNLTGSTDPDDENWTTVSAKEKFEKGKDTYSFIDETFLQMNKGMPVTYRVRRMYSAMWQWKTGAGHVTGLLPWTFVLPHAEQATVRKTDVWNDEQHVVEVQFTEKSTSYDASGNFIIRSEEDYQEYGRLRQAGKVDYAKVVVNSTEDWNRMCEEVTGNMTVVLTNDLTLTSSDKKLGGSGSRGFLGNLDGGGHTITLNYNASDAYAAPIRKTESCTIKNLKVNGKMTASSMWNGGLIGQVARDAFVNLENIDVEVTIVSNKDGDASSGGIVGIVEESATVMFKNCAFRGELTGASSHSNGGFVGVAVKNTRLDFVNCLFAPIAISTKTDGCGTFARYDNTASFSLNNTYYTRTYGSDNGAINASSMTYDVIATKLGADNWKAGNNAAYPVMLPSAENFFLYSVFDPRAKMQLCINMHGENGVETRTVDITNNKDAMINHKFTQELSRKCVEYSFDLLVIRDSSPLEIAFCDKDTLVVPVAKVETGDLANYRFVNSNKITELTPVQKQSSVELHWKTSGGDHDFFRIMRKEEGSAKDFEPIATNLEQMSYEDKSVRPQHNYIYRVESVWQCEGTNIESATCTAWCAKTGMISGYVRMADGTAIAGQVVECRPQGNISGASALYTQTTSETGYYEFSGLPYQSQGTYVITVPVSGSGSSYTGPNDAGTVDFSEDSNWTQNFNYYMDTYYVYSGNVYYRNTSIPVPGVSFMLDGKIMHDASKNAITTNTQGAFTLSIPSGTHSVQAVKAGHIFAADGFLINEDAREGESKTLYDFKKNVSGAVIWDSTKVMLRGRVVGGDIQGSKPLGEGLSKNNLGDSLKIVMQLEGDNASYLILDPKDETVKSASYDVAFGPNKKNVTRVNVNRYTLAIRPDSTTGEYQLELPPAKYKVIEVSAQGYATLFQEGKVGETVDLSFNVKGDTCVYNRIYHAVPNLEVTQFNSGNQPYYGVKSTKATDNIGNSSEVVLWGYKHITENDSVPMYSFGYPVFMANSPYAWMLQACEKYYWNNDINKQVDIVNLDSGNVTIKNYMVDTDDAKLTKTIELDKTGFGSYVFTPGNANFNLSDEMGLRSVDITLEYDGGYYDIKPLNGKIMQGYVMATQAKSGGTTTIAAGYPVLVDILRDPPGSGSSSYIEAGSKLSYSYSPTFEGSLGASMAVKNGTYATVYKGALVVPPSGMATETGTISEAHADKVFSFTLSSTFNGSWTTSYNFDVSERIQTKTGQKWIGGKADLFMGTNENLILQDAIAVRAIPEDQYLLMKHNEGGSFKVESKDGKSSTTVKVPVGCMRLITKGVDADGKNVYLVRDEVMSVTTKVQSTFIHSQHYIENELLPSLVKMRNALVQVPGVDGQALANKTKELVYVSTVQPGDAWFGDEKHMDLYFPSSWSDSEKEHAINKVSDYNQQMCYWLNFLMRNEQEKINVVPTNLVKNYDIDGGVSSLQYSESFSAGCNKSGFVKWPGLNNADISKLFPEWAIKSIEDISKGWEASHYQGNDLDGHQTVNLNFATATSGTKIKFTPILAFTFNDKSGNNESESKKIGFTISMASKSSLNVDVYRTVSGQYGIKSDTPDPFLKLTTSTLKELAFGQPYHPESDIKVYSSFVFRTRGGVTCQPYEGERKTKWYQPGTVIDVATIAADKPRIWIDEPVVSNVPFDEPARFVLHMANETDYPERATLIFNYALDAGCNPNGAKVCVDGKVLGPGGESITLYPAIGSDGKHTVFTKEITVYPSKAFNYEDLSISLKDPEDAGRVFTQKFSAHFVPTGGKVKISVPSNNWVMNTESPYDGKRKAHYMPVRIEGFDINWPNFDHIELQYKLSTQGDKDWVNVCSYYADKELRSKASGVTDTIPNSGVIVASFYGENDPVEQHYDIRAVTYCRHAGGFLTGSSEVLTGIKDTRLPIVFGTPSPTDGILGIGSDIKVQFSEAIAGNYLRNINNFEVLGTINSNDISTSTSLSFNGDSYAFTEGSRNLTGKNFTVDVMLNPAPDVQPMTVFLHGGEERGLRFGLTADRHLEATINGQTVQSDEPVEFTNSLHEVAYALDQSGDSMAINFFDGSKQIGHKPLSGKYESESNLKLGYDIVAPKNSYKGDMLEFRLWNRAMTSANLSEYGMKKLNGYEYGLLDYYPLNEGEGEFAYDKAPGSMDLILDETNWKRPVGISLEMKGDKGLRLKPDKFARTADHDYTLTFWFRTRDLASTLFSNGPATADEQDKINIGINDGFPYVRSSGFEQPVDVHVSDGAWHHFALTVNRSQNVANVYIDRRLTESFAADSLQGISGDHIALGATYVDKNTPKNQMTGHIDEVGMFSSVLPVNLIEEYSTHTPIGTMSALMAYLDFGRSEKMDNNLQHLEPTGISIKRYLDSQGKIAARQDTLVATAEVEAIAARDYYAPMVSNSQMDNLNYTFATKDNELLIDVTEPDFMVEKTNVYVTVKDIPDLQGNLLASPLTMNLYVYRNPLRWTVKRIEKKIAYGEGCTFEATIKNLSGVRQNFRIDDLPVWIQASETQGVIGSLDEKTIQFTVSEFINVGTYNEQVCLVGDNSMSEPLPITLRVRDVEPEWTVSDRLKQMNQTMMMICRVKIDGVIANSSEDILAAFDENQQTLGVAHIEVNNKAMANEALAYMTIYGYTNTDGSKPKINFRFYDASAGSIFSLLPEQDVIYEFQKDATLGSASNPVVLVNGNNNVQTLKLKKGWNWVTFNVVPKNSYFDGDTPVSSVTVGEFLNGISKWEAGDKITSINGTTVQQFTCREDKTTTRGYKWDDEDNMIFINSRLMYNIYSMSDKTVYVEGDLVYGSIAVHKDWNRIAYNSTINLPIAQALSDYTEKASEGDVVKSQDGFAIATKVTSGSSSSIVWKGTLQYMEAGKGYMLKRLSDEKVSFFYPLYYGDNRYSSTEANQAAPRRSSVNTISTMNIVAAVEGIETEEGDRLVVFSGVDRMAEAVADSEQNFYLNIGSDSKDNEPLTFAIERDGETIAMTSSRISYVPNQVLGTPNEPTAINFTSLEEMPHDGKWYTVSGILLEKKPTESGLYIYDGKVVLIK